MRRISPPYRSRRQTSALVVLVLIGTLCGPGADGFEHGASAAESAPQPESVIDAGRYLVIIGQCNDCHTPGYDEAYGNLPEADWLIGSPIGWRGPWGTTYPSNLRLLVQSMTEDAWVNMLRTRTERPPMPWANLNKMRAADARAIYQFIRSLGAAGELMPTALGVGEEPATPYLVLEPVQPKQTD